MASVETIYGLMQGAKLILTLAEQAGEMTEEEVAAEMDRIHLKSRNARLLWESTLTDPA